MYGAKRSSDKTKMNFKTKISHDLVLKFILVLVLVSFISNRFNFYITVLSNISISVFMIFASNNFYIYFIIVLSNTIIFLRVYFLCMNTKSKPLILVLFNVIAYQANKAHKE